SRGWPHAVESVATSSWNPWPHVHGIDGHMRVEYALSALRRAYASGTTRVSYDGKSVDYGSAEDLLARIRTIERAIAGTTRPLPIAGLAGFSRGDR
ncbi:MAG: phage head-tail joining protein, partial [Gemmobacter sp.]